jgi:bacterioferritin
MKVAGPVEPINEPQQMLAKASRMEDESARDYNQSAIECGANADSVSKQMFEQLVRDEEGHFDEYDKQLDNINRFGPSYLALQSFNRTPEGAAPAAE